MAPPSSTPPEKGGASKPASKAARRQHIKPILPLNLIRAQNKAVTPMTPSFPSATSSTHPPIDVPAASSPPKLEPIEMAATGSETTHMTPAGSEPDSGSTTSRPSTRGGRFPTDEVKPAMMKDDKAEIVAAKSVRSDDARAPTAIPTKPTIDLNIIVPPLVPLNGFQGAHSATSSVSMRSFASPTGHNGAGISQDHSHGLNGFSTFPTVHARQVPMESQHRPGPHHRPHPSAASISFGNMYDASQGPSGFAPHAFNNPASPLNPYHSNRLSGLSFGSGGNRRPSQEQSMTQLAVAAPRNNSISYSVGGIEPNLGVAPSTGEHNPHPMSSDYLQPANEHSELRDQPLANGMSFSEHARTWIQRPRFADCEVYLDLPQTLTSWNSLWPSTPQGPLRFAAHRLVLGDNRVLEALTLQQTGKELYIRPNDDFARADGFWAAFQFLYGRQSRIALPPPLQRAPRLERLHFSLSVAAAGAFLQEPHLSVTGLSDACSLLDSWQAAEVVLNFILVGLRVMPLLHSSKQLIPDYSYRHGVYVDSLVRAVLMFVVDNFPRQLTMDTSSSPTAYPRLPSLPGPPPIARGSMSIEGASKSPSSEKVSSIRFGDMVPNLPGKDTQPTMPIISRILLDLPMPLLKLVLEHDALARLSGSMSSSERKDIARVIVAERERRRIAVSDAVKAGRIVPDAIVARLDSWEPQTIPGGWDNVCWKEEVVDMADSFMIARSWLPVFAGSRG